MKSPTQPYFAVIPAAGCGERMGQPIPKQYLPLGTQTVIEHSATLFLQDASCQAVCIALATDDNTFQTLGIANHPKVRLCLGGGTRMQSVFNALCAIAQAVSHETWIAVHDAARPLLHREDLTRLLYSAQSARRGAILATPVSDHIVQVEADEIIGTLPREPLWQAQTPQVFQYGALYAALNHAILKQQIMRDESSAIIAHGRRVSVVPAAYPNFKLTTPQDYALIQAYLANARGAV